MIFLFCTDYCSYGHDPSGCPVSGHPLLDCAYEVVSAVATVGLTRSLTSQLPAAGKIIVILVMYMGRIGPITLAVALGRRTRHVDADIQRPEQRILIG